MVDHDVAIRDLHAPGALSTARNGFVVDAFVALLLVVPLWGFFVLPAPSLASGLGVVICHLCLMQLLQCSRDVEAGPISIGFYAFVGVWAGLASVVQVAVGRLPWPDFA